MNSSVVTKTHWSVWVVGGLSLVWHLMGCANYLFQATMTPEMLGEMSASQQAIISNRPAYATGAFAIAVFGGAIGSVFLLLRKRLSLWFFLIALIGVIVAMIPVFSIVNTGVEFPMFEKVMYLGLTPIFGAFFVWFTRIAIRRGWIGDGPVNI